MAEKSIFTEDFKLTPYWWEERAERPDTSPAGLPSRADVVVIGAGVTGLEAARRLAEAGRDVLVLDAGLPGDGASTRNAGMIGRNFMHPYSKLKETIGIDKARGYFNELQDAYDAVEALASSDAAAVGWRRCGRVIGALSKSLCDRLHREYELRARDLDETVDILSADGINEEFGSHLCHGGIRLPGNGRVQPALYHRFLFERAGLAGATIISHAAVHAVDREKIGFQVRSAERDILCRDVMVATNGYTGNALPAFKKRLLPITSYMVATEPLPDDRIAALLPRRRTYHDNRQRSHFFTFSRDGDRILVGGRTGSIAANLRNLARKMHGDLAYFFPELKGVRLSHAWQGNCAAPVDLFPGFGQLNGMTYALGYSFSGMAMGPHLARKAASLILGDRQAANSLFHRDRFPVIPLPARGPWTMPAVLGWRAWSDRPKEITRRM